MALCRDLERAVEDLSELLESPIEQATIVALRQKVTDKTVSSLYSFECKLDLFDVPLGVRIQAK